MKRWIIGFVCAAFVVVPFASFAQTADLRLITQAKYETILHPDSPDAWENLAQANYAFLESHSFDPLPAFEKAWRDAEHKALVLRYGSLTRPKTLQYALELALVYSDHWKGPCQAVADCRDNSESELYLALARFVAGETWDLSTVAEQQAGLWLNRRHAAWMNDRPDIFAEAKDMPTVLVTFPEPTSSIISVATSSTLEPFLSLRIWLVIGSFIALCSLFFILRFLGHRKK